MSAVLPYSREQLEEWRRRDAVGAEPIELVIPGWSVSSSRGLPNERRWRFVRDGATVTMSRDWDRPLSPGGPMVTASTRSFRTPGGRAFEIHRTSLFQGQARVVEVTFLTGPGWSARIVFEGCTPEVVDEVLGRIRPSGELSGAQGAPPKAAATPRPGCDVVLESMSVAVPPRCASCGAPKETTLDARKRKSFIVGGSITRSFAIPYCKPCAARARAVRRKGFACTWVTLAIALLGAAIAYAVPELSLPVLVAVPTALSVAFATAAMTLLAPKAPDPPATATADAVRLVSFRGYRSVVYCVNAEWGAAFARANGVAPVPRGRASRFGKRALFVALTIVPAAALVAWLAATQ